MGYKVNQNKGFFGGFVAKNNGKIINCYTSLHIKGKKAYSAGFVSSNDGSISKSYSYSNPSKLEGGFYNQNNGNIDNDCYFLYNQKNKKRVLDLRSGNHNQKVDNINNNEELAKLGFDTDEVWTYINKDIPIGFKDEKWFYKYNNNDKEPIVISNARELFNFSNKVNNGDTKYQNAYVILANDISLSNKEWIPIGYDRLNTFNGVFDGQGYTVSNFVINNKDIDNKGFFGFLKGEIYNLSVDGLIKNGQCIGGLVAQNLEGTIGCCSAVTNIRTKNGIVGGLVGVNSGYIFNSYSAGSSNNIVIPVWLYILGILLFFLPMIFLITNKEDDIKNYTKVPYDEFQVPIPEDNKPTNNDDNFVSFEFEAEIPIDLYSGKCNFNFKLPSNTNHNVVVELQITDNQALQLLGTTGRSEEEQAKLDASEFYDPDIYRTVIARSGAIKPGYQLDDLLLFDFVRNANITPARYNAMIYLQFYDVKTNKRALLETQVPVVIDIK